MNEQRKTLIILFIASFVISLLALTGLRAAFLKVGEIEIFDNSENIMEDMNYVVDEDSPFFAEYKNNKRVNVLALGLNDNLSDTIMLVSYDPDRQRVDIISIPRDTYVQRKGYSGAFLKINSIYQDEGAVGTAEAVSEVLLGMPVNYYAVIDYQGVANIVDAIGGVPVHLDFHMKYSDPYDTPPLYIDFEPGDHLLTGEDAMKFLRYRKGYPNGDIGRIEAHQAFMKSAFSQAIDAGVLDTARAVVENVESDISLGTITRIATKALGLEKERIFSYTLPGVPKTTNGLSYWYSNKEETAALIDLIYGPEPESAEEGEEGEVGEDAESEISENAEN